MDRTCTHRMTRLAEVTLILQDLAAASTQEKNSGSSTGSAALGRPPSPGGRLHPSARRQPSSSGPPGRSPPSSSDRPPSPPGPSGLSRPSSSPFAQPAAFWPRPSSPLARPAYLWPRSSSSLPAWSPRKPFRIPPRTPRALSRPVFLATPEPSSFFHRPLPRFPVVVSSAIPRSSSLTGDHHPRH